MKFSCDKYLLQSACNIATRATAAKSPISALEGLLLEAKKELTVTGYDLKKGIFSTVEAEIEETGAIVVGARFFGEMIRRMPDGIVTFSSDDNLNVHVTCGKSEFNFMGISAEDYPEIPSVDGLKSITISQTLLKSMIDQTLFSVASTDVRPIYTGSLFEIEGKELTVVSVDGYRLAKRCETVESLDMEEGSFVVPGSALSDIQKIATDEDGEVTISVGKKHISFIIGNTVVISRRLEGEFLNYKKSIPASFKATITIEKSELLSVIERVSLIINEKNTSPVRLTLKDGFIDCRCMTPMGKAEDVCYCEGDGNGLEIGFNDRYLADALKASGADKLKLNFNTSSSPCIITDVNGSNKFTYMILPVRLRAGD